jgi:protein TonB
VVLVAAAVTWFLGHDRTLPQSPVVPPASERAFDTALPASPVPAAQEIGVPPTASTPVPDRQIPSTAAEPSPRPQQDSAATEPIRPVSAPPANVDLLTAPITQPARPAADTPIAAETATRPAAATPAVTLLTDVLTAPVRTRLVRPEYPAIARAAELEGDVVLGAIVGPDGKVSRVEVVQSVHPVLDEAARKAVLQYEYAPARRNGIPEAATIRIAVSFRLH